MRACGSASGGGGGAVATNAAVVRRMSTSRGGPGSAAGSEKLVQATGRTSASSGRGGRGLRWPRELPEVSSLGAPRPAGAERILELQPLLSVSADASLCCMPCTVTRLLPLRTTAARCSLLTCTAPNRPFSLLISR